MAHNVECIEIGQKLGSKALTVWIADGSNFRANRISTACSTGISNRWPRSTRGCLGDWRVFIEHKLYEPAFYSTVISDWGTSLMAAEALGPKALLPR